MAANNGAEMAFKILDAFGLSVKGLVEFNISYRFDDMVRIEIECLPTGFDMTDGRPFLKKYKIVEDDE